MDKKEVSGNLKERNECLLWYYNVMFSMVFNGLLVIESPTHDWWDNVGRRCSQKGRKKSENQRYIYALYHIMNMNVVLVCLIVTYLIHMRTICKESRSLDKIVQQFKFYKKSCKWDYDTAIKNNQSCSWDSFRCAFFWLSKYPTNKPAILSWIEADVYISFKLFFVLAVSRILLVESSVPDLGFSY